MRVAVETIRGLEAERAVNHVSRGRRDIRREIQQAHRLAFDPPEFGHRIGFRDEGRPPRDGVKKRGRERIHVAAKILRLPGEFFRCDIVRRGPDFALLLILFFDEDGQAEVHDLRRLPVGKQDVARLDVAMNEAQFQPGLQPDRDLDADVNRLFLGHLFHLRHERLQAPLIHDLHGEVEQSMMLAGRKHFHDVRIIQARRDAGLALEALHKFRVRAVFALHHLDGHGTV